jgi:hypothetical protein
MAPPLLAELCEKAESIIEVDNGFWIINAPPFEPSKPPEPRIGEPEFELLMTRLLSFIVSTPINAALPPPDPDDEPIEREFDHETADPLAID